MVAGPGCWEPADMTDPLRPATAAAAEYAAHCGARLFFGLAAVSDYPTVRELAFLGGHAASLVVAYIQEGPDPDLRLANRELDAIMRDLLPLTDGRRSQHSHSELLGPVSAAVDRSFPGSLVVLRAGAGGSGFLRISRLLDGLIDRLTGADHGFAGRLRELAPGEYLSHRDVIVLSYPAARAGDPGVLCQLLGHSIPELELDAAATQSPACGTHVADAIGARRLGFSYLDELLFAAASDAGAFSDRIVVVRHALAELGYGPDLPGLLGRAWTRAAPDPANAAAIPPHELESVLATARRLEPEPYRAADCAAETAALLDLLGNGIPPAQIIGAPETEQWPSARAILATSAVFNHVGLDRLRRFVRLPGPPGADRLLLRQRKDELVTKALELLSFGAAFEGAPV